MVLKKGNLRIFNAIVLTAFILCLMTGCSKGSKDNAGSDSGNQVSDTSSEETQGSAARDNSTTQSTSDSQDNSGSLDNTGGQGNVNIQDNPDDNDASGKNDAGDPGQGNDAQSELMRLYTLTLDNMKPIGEIAFPENSSEYSKQLASQALSICSQGTKQLTSQFLNSSGFQVLLQGNFDKPKSDTSHTCAFTLATKKIELNGRERDLLVIAIRGTDSGEWYSNFDFASSHLDDAVFAENFLQAAQDVYVQILPKILEYPDAVMLICGHSRGAACANLLGMTLDDLRSKEDIFVYTFATPNTIRGEFEEEKYTNIFNLINTADMVTYLPLAGWGYKRVGNDIYLEPDAEQAETLENEMNGLYSAAPTISDYYLTRHKIEGLSVFEEGITVYDTMRALAASMTGIDNGETGGLTVAEIFNLSQKGAVPPELYPLIGFLKHMAGTGGMNLTVFKQHMPAVYQELIAN